jgi:hypothetical protein
MPIRFRPWDPRRRFVCPVPGRIRRRWIALHGAPPDWAELFTRALDLMMIEAAPAGGGLSGLCLGGNAGQVRWRGARRWTVIDVELTGFSERKRALVVAALVKAARYS